MTYRLKYRKTIMRLDVNPRKGICVACEKSVHKGEIKTTNIHHYKYKYMTKTVKKNPLLALENTLELCYRCHQIADALRVLNDNKSEQIVKALLVHPLSFIFKLRGVQALLSHPRPRKRDIINKELKNWNWEESVKYEPF